MPSDPPSARSRPTSTPRTSSRAPGCGRTWNSIRWTSCGVLETIAQDTGVDIPEDAYRDVATVAGLVRFVAVHS